MILVVVWIGAIAGAIVEMVWIDHPKWVAALIYMSLGWVAAIAFPGLWSDMGVAGTLLVAVGGLLYTAGAVVYATQRPDPSPRVFGYHEVFHALVIAAAAAQFAAIAFFALPARPEPAAGRTRRRRPCQNVGSRIRKESCKRFTVRAASTTFGVRLKERSCGVTPQSRPERSSSMSQTATATPKNGLKGLSIERRFSTAGTHPFDEVEWEIRDAVIGDPREPRLRAARGRVPEELVPERDQHRRPEVLPRAARHPSSASPRSNR